MKKETTPINSYNVEVVYHTYNTFRRTVLAPDLDTAKLIIKKMFEQETKDCYFDQVREYAE